MLHISNVSLSCSKRQQATSMHHIGVYFINF